MAEIFTEDQIKKVIGAIKQAINGEHLSTLNILNAALSAMVAAGSFSMLRGEQKKKLVLYAIGRVIDESSLNDNDKLAIKSIVDTIICATVDIIIDASKGEYEFVRKPGIFGCLPPC